MTILRGGGASQVEPDFRGTTGYVSVGEIWDGDGFNKENFFQLVTKASGISINSSSDLKNVENKVNSANVSAADMRDVNNGNDIVVKFGGLDWTTTYLSKYINGDLILTLWLANSTQLSGKQYESGKTFNSDGSTSWNAGTSATDLGDSVPDNMYGTSYIRAVVLNNGGQYKKQYDSANLTTATQNSNSVFAPFTMGEIPKYLVRPGFVDWQREQSAIELGISSYNYPNDAVLTGDGWFDETYNYYGKTGYNAWGMDYLWLPSITEIGENSSKDKDEILNGMWQTSINQNSNTVYSWLRSAHQYYAVYAYYVGRSGSNTSGGSVYGAGAVRPALHLNLTAVANTFPSTLTIKYDDATSCNVPPDEVMILTPGLRYQTTLKKGETASISASAFSQPLDVVALVKNNSYSYFASFNSKPTSNSDVMRAIYSWTGGDVELTLYVYQRFTITFDKGYADSGTVPDPVYKVYGTNAPLPTNDLIHKGFDPNGWNTSQNGQGTSYISSYTQNLDVTLYTNWTYVYASINITIVTLDKSGIESSTAGGKVSVTGKVASGNQARNYSGASSFTTLKELESSITATANSGYVFLGFNTTKGVPTPATAQDKTYYITPTGNERYDIYVFFKQVSSNKLQWTSEEGGYWYFEDGEFPQYEVGSELSATLSNYVFSQSAYTIKYNNGSEVEIPVYFYDGIHYAKVTIGGTTKWFGVQPIRWRVSEYGTPQTSYPEGFETYGSTVQYSYAVTDKILFASIMTSEKIDGSAEKSSAQFWLNDYVNSELYNTLLTQHWPLDYATEAQGEMFDVFKPDGTQDIVDSTMDSYNMLVGNSTKDKNRAKLTAFASFLMYGTTAYADTYDTYWSNDLETSDGREEYGCGVVVTSDGQQTLRWLNQMCGVRLSYMCSEISRY